MELSYQRQVETLIESFERLSFICLMGNFMEESFAVRPQMKSYWFGLRYP